MHKIKIILKINTKFKISKNYFANYFYFILLPWIQGISY